MKSFNEKLGLCCFLLLLHVTAVLCGDEYPGVTFATCNLQSSSVSTSFHALARVNSTKREMQYGDENDGRIFCQTQNSVKGNLALEFVVTGDPPITILLQTADLFVPDLKSSNILCSYGGIGPENRVSNKASPHSYPTSEDGSYVCDEIDGLRITFSGIYKSLSRKRRRSKRTAKQESMISKMRCSTHSLKPNRYQDFRLLGKFCLLRNDDPTIGRRWMFNKTGQPDCLPCCVDHHWDEVTEQCEKCPPRSTQPTLNVWRHCEPTHEEHSISFTSTSTASSSTTTSVKLTERSMQSSSNQPSISPTVQITKERIQRPYLAPDGVRVSETGRNHAIVLWNEVTSVSESVSKYKVTLESLNFGKTFRFETENALITLRNLTSGSLYKVIIQVGNTAGYGPFSDNLLFETDHALPQIPKLSEKEVTEVTTGPEIKAVELKIPIAMICLSALIIFVFAYFLLNRVVSKACGHKGWK